MATGDVPDLIARYANGRGPRELARASAGADGEPRVAAQGWSKYATGKARHNDFPSAPTIQGMSDALEFGDDTEVTLAFARSVGLRIRDVDPVLVRELRGARGLEGFDDHPELVAQLVRTLALVGQILRDQR